LAQDVRVQQLERQPETKPQKNARSVHARIPEAYWSTRGLLIHSDTVCGFFSSGWNKELSHDFFSSCFRGWMT
jgi:hypothetical protein